jgi:integrase
MEQWDMETQQRRPLTDRELRAWLATGQTDRGIGEGLTFVASASAASKGKASWILRFRVNGRPREKVLGRYPELSLKGARDQARKDREEIERGVDVATTKQAVKARLANDALRYMVRMFKLAVRNHWIERNPAADFEQADAGGVETPRDRFLTLAELERLARSMVSTDNFGRENELAVWLLLALCVRKMELLSARWEDFDFNAKVWTLDKEITKTKVGIQIPLADPVISWLNEARVLASGRPYVFPARRLVRRRLGQARVNRFPHVGPDTLNVALKRLGGLDIAHFTVHDMRRTARTNLSTLGVNRCVAERALNHKLKGVEGIYDQHDYFEERSGALDLWAATLAALSRGEKATDLLARRKTRP